MPKWKKRPGGKRGWRKINERPARTKPKNNARDRDEDLFFVDTGKKHSLTKAAIRETARLRLEASGHIPQRPDPSAPTHVRKKRKLTAPIIKPQSKSTRNRKKMKLRRVAKNPMRKKKVRDVWAGDTSSDDDCEPKSAAQQSESEESASAVERSDNEESDDGDKYSEADLSVSFGAHFCEQSTTELVKSMKKAGAVIKGGRRAVPNQFVPKAVGISLPTHGESVNPLPQAMIQTALRRERIARKQDFQKKWSSKSDMKWFLDRSGHKMPKEDLSETKKLLAMKKANRPFVKEFNTVLKRWKAEQRKGDSVKKEKGSLATRPRHNSASMLNPSKRGQIHGKRRVTWFRAPKALKKHKVGRNWRTAIDSKSADPVSHLFYELRAQNRIEGSRKSGFVFKKKPFFGAVYKTSTRVGRVHHANVGNRIFRDFENDE